MRNLKWLVLAVLLLFAGSAKAQAVHQVSLAWTLSTDDTTTNCTTTNPCSQNVYRVPGACTSTTVFVSPLANVTATQTSYIDTAVSPGQMYCYAVTFVDNSGESVFSNTVTAKVLPFPPTNVAAAQK